ncbi:hypothetical protein BASA61_006156 [Batrachochytrium salamandrivorans]|nr:hypothetical protein BASA61_006156 [Batrachochytrium salamandrivorans]
MFDPLLWVLHHFITHYAGQTTQGNKDDGDGVDQASGSKRCRQLTTRNHTYNSLPRPDRKATHRIKAMRLYLQILNQERSAKVDTGYGKYPSHVHGSNHHQGHSHPLRMITPNPMKCRFLLSLGESGNQILQS